MWTTDKPSQPGFYWYREVFPDAAPENRYGSPFVIRVLRDLLSGPSSESLFASVLPDSEYGFEHGDAEAAACVDMDERLKGEFYGPIFPPE
jgi:hypothetical protein